MSENPETVDRVVVDVRPSSPSPRPHVLVTNDDGISSPGIRPLAHALAGDLDVVVAAPATDTSGSGTGIGRFDPRGGVEVAPEDLDGVPGYAIAGPPGLAVTAAALGAFGPKPDLVVSGINAGANTGRSVIHSGTVGAVLTARSFGIRGLAVSLQPSDPFQWDTAAAVAARVARWLVGLGSVLTVNVNVPALPREALRGVRWADLDEFGHFQVATTVLSEARLQLEVTSPDTGLDPASDTALLREGYVTLTPLSSVAAASFPPVAAAAVVGEGFPEPT